MLRGPSEGHPVSVVPPSGRSREGRLSQELYEIDREGAMKPFVLMG